MEAPTTGAWTASNATLSKVYVGVNGSKALRVTRTGAGAYAYQTVLTIGKTYVVKGMYSGDGSTAPAIGLGGADTCIGSTSVVLQSIDCVGIAVGTQLKLRVPANSYANFDNITVTEVASTVVREVSRSLDFSSATTTRVVAPVSTAITNAFQQAGTYTVYSRFKVTSSEENEIIWGFDTSGSNRHGFVWNSVNSLLGFQIYNGSTYTAKSVPLSSISLNVWHTAVAINNAGTLNLYVDGILATGTTNNYAISNSQGRFWVGSSGLGTNGSRAIRGFVDATYVWNRVLTSSEISGLNRNIISPSALLIAWDFNSPSTSTAYDTSGNGNNGVITGALPDTNTPPNVSASTPLNPTVVSDVSRSMANNGTAGNYVNVPTNATLNFASTGFAVSLWIKNSDVGTATKRPIYKRSSNTGFLLQTRADGDYEFGVGSSTALVLRTFGVTASEAPKWNHLVATFDGSFIRAYKNGVFFSLSTCSSIADATGTDLSFLSDKLTNGFSGNIDKVRIYSRALSASEISAMYNQKIIPRNGLVGEWLMDEGSGNTFNDTSGNNNTGTGTGVTFSTDVPN